MARDNNFRIIPANGVYPGLTAIAIGNEKELVSVGTGAKVERALEARAKEMGVNNG